MKTEIKRVPSYVPVTVSITFETEREFMMMLQMLGSMSQHDMIKFANSSTIKDAIENFGIDDARNFTDLWTSINEVKP